MNSISLSDLGRNNYLVGHQAISNSPTALIPARESPSDAKAIKSENGLSNCYCPGSDLRSVLADIVEVFHELIQSLVETIGKLKGRDGLNGSTGTFLETDGVQHPDAKKGGWGDKLSDLISTGKKIYEGAKSIWDFFTGKESGEKAGNLLSGAAGFISSLF